MSRVAVAKCGEPTQILEGAVPANQGLPPAWRAASVMTLRLRVRRASMNVLRPASARRQNPSG